jgi:hypothetical protein
MTAAVSEHIPIDTTNPQCNVGSLGKAIEARKSIKYTYHLQINPELDCDRGYKAFAVVVEGCIWIRVALGRRLVIVMDRIGTRHV